MMSSQSRSAADSVPALLTLALIRRHFFPVGERTVFRLIASGRFPAADIRLGGKLRLWKRETVEGWIQMQAAGKQGLISGRLPK